MERKLILASASPRRLALLADIGVVPNEVAPADIDETLGKGELPRNAALRLACEKGAFVAAQRPESLVLSADTIVALGRRVLPKAETEDEVRLCLKLLSGRRHRVYTGVALYVPGGKRIEKLCESVVLFKRLSLHEIEAYVVSGEGIGKAGAYGIQGKAASMIRFISGSYSNIVGLPLYEVAQMLVMAQNANKSAQLLCHAREGGHPGSFD